MKIIRHLFLLPLPIGLLLATAAPAKPLKVYILCGQSNMEGHAQIHTFPAVAKDPKTAALYQKMVGPDGKPVVCDDVWIAYSYGNSSGEPAGKRSGKLTAGFGSQHHVGTGKIGPEFTFGITMQELQGEPILLLKDAWGGKSLQVDFRPPSGGEPEDEKAREKAGRYYRLLIEHVKEILADPAKVYPGYDAKEGYDLAGFVWFQGFNDLVGRYPMKQHADGRKGLKDYSEYGRLLSCFIRDVRRDLSAPKLPFVIGVLGTGGPDAKEGTQAFRTAMAAPALSNEFKGSVANVFTHEYWPTEIDAVQTKISEITREFTKQDRAIRERRKKGENWKAEAEKLEKEKRAKIEASLSKDELFTLEKGISNRGFHYHGSAKFFAQIGKAFAEALVTLDQKK